MRENVWLKDVLGWLQAAMEAAQRDLGDAEGTISALSYRELRVHMYVDRDSTRVHIITRNSGFGNGEVRVHRTTTYDGVEVKWEEELGVPTGADWLPWDFIDWLRGEP
jgi:hypothetical protein